MRAPRIDRAAAALAIADATPAQAPADAQAAAAEVIRQLDLQTALPHGPETSAEFLWRFFSWHLVLPEWTSIVLWVAVLCAVSYLAYLFLIHARGDLFARWRLSQQGRDGTAEGGALGPQAAAEVMMTADELARQGRFVEAMHTLLLQSLADMRQRLGEQFADSLTSREILRSSRLPDRGRASLREIIARVEWTYFGDHPAGPSDYQACREKFSELALALNGEAPT
jgi:hypothetical protein